MWPTIVWSQLEYTLGITCACVPVMRPIFGKFFSLHHSKNSGRSYNMMRGHGPVPRGNRDSNDHTYPLTSIGTSTVVQSGKSEQLVLADHHQQELEDGGPRAIQVLTDWDVHHTPDGGGIVK